MLHFVGSAEQLGVLMWEISKTSLCIIYDHTSYWNGEYPWSYITPQINWQHVAGVCCICSPSEAVLDNLRLITAAGLPTILSSLLWMSAQNIFRRWRVIWQASVHKSCAVTRCMLKMCVFVLGVRRHCELTKGVKAAEFMAWSVPLPIQQLLWRRRESQGATADQHKSFSETLLLM